jgi:GAF domain-containing protein
MCLLNLRIVTEASREASPEADKRGTMPEWTDRQGTMPELSGLVLAEHDLIATVTWVAELARDRSGADMAGITVVLDGMPRSWTYTDPETLPIDDVQYEAGRGPCLEAVRAQVPVRIDDTATDERWPEFDKEACAHGVISILSLPISVHSDSAFGAFNLYSRRRAQFVGQPDYALSQFVDQAAVLLLNARDFWDARQRAEGLQVALQSRATIEQAIGILMAPGGRTPEEAFQLLVRASQRENRKLREIAADIVQRTSGRAKEQ